MGKMLVWAWPIVAGLTAAAAGAQTGDVVTLEQLLQRAGVYVLDFEARFSSVVTEEH